MVDEIGSISEFHSVGARGRYLTHPSLATTIIGRAGEIRGRGHNCPV
jgi:hypothetical protein